jgi:hypothetical protein
VAIWVRGSYRDLAFLYAVGRYHHALFENSSPGKHLTCVIGGSRVSIFLFAAGDSGSDRLGRGDGRGLDGRGCGGGSGYGRLSHGWAGRIAPFAVTADNAGGDGER